MAMLPSLPFLLIAVGASSAPSPSAVRGHTGQAPKADINYHSSLEHHAQGLREAQHEVEARPQAPKAPVGRSPAEERRSDSVMRLAASAKAARAAQQAAVSGQSQEEEEEEQVPADAGESQVGIPGLGRLVPADDPNLAHVDVTHVDHLPPHKVLGLKKAVGRMQDAVVGAAGGRDARAAAEAAASERVPPPEAPEAPEAQAVAAGDGAGPAAQAVAARHAAIAASSGTIQQATQMHEQFKAKMESHTNNMHQALVDHAKEVEEQRLAQEAAAARQRAEVEAERLQAAKERAEAERRKAEDAALRLRAAEVNARLKQQEEQAKIQEKILAEKAKEEAAAKAKVTEEQRALQEKEDAAKEEAHKRLVEYRAQQKAAREAEEAEERQRRLAARERAEADRMEREAERAHAKPSAAAPRPFTLFTTAAFVLALGRL